DGLRLDLGTNRPDLWARVRRAAYSAGHPIVIFEEGSASVIPGVTDFAADDNSISDGQMSNDLALNDIPRLYRIKFGKEGRYKVEVIYSDYVRVSGESGKQAEDSSSLL